MEPKYKNQIGKLGRFVKELDKTGEELFKVSVEEKGKNLEKAVSDGWFVPFLRVAEGTGLIIASVGGIINNEYVRGFGLGVTTMAGAYDLGIIYIQNNK